MNEKRSLILHFFQEDLRIVVIGSPPSSSATGSIVTGATGGGPYLGAFAAVLSLRRDFFPRAGAMVVLSALVSA